METIPKAPSFIPSEPNWSRVLEVRLQVMTEQQGLICLQLTELVDKVESIREHLGIGFDLGDFQSCDDKQTN